MYYECNTMQQNSIIPENGNLLALQAKISSIKYRNSANVEIIDTMCQYDNFQKDNCAISSYFGKKTLRAYRPKIVGITGSVGKTSTAYAISLALGTKRRVRSPEKNYNNELGLPLAILGECAKGKSVLAGWRSCFAVFGLRLV